MGIDEVKEYLRVDGNDEDKIISSMMTVAEDYIVSAIGGYDSTDVVYVCVHHSAAPVIT